MCREILKLEFGILRIIWCYNFVIGKVITFFVWCNVVKLIKQVICSFVERNGTFSGFLIAETLETYNALFMLEHGFYYLQNLQT